MTETVASTFCLDGPGSTARLRSLGSWRVAEGANDPRADGESGRRKRTAKADGEKNIAAKGYGPRKAATETRREN